MSTYCLLANHHSHPLEDTLTLSSFLLIGACVSRLFVRRWASPANSYLDSWDIAINSVCLIYSGCEVIRYLAYFLGEWAYFVQ